MPGDFFPRLEEQGLIRDQDKQWMEQQTFSAQKIITGSLQAEQEISSSNFVSGSTGWQIDGGGSAEFQNVTVRGSINADDIDSGTLNAARISVLGDVTLGGQLSASGVRVGQKVDADQESKWRGIGVEWSGSTTVTALMRDVTAGRTIFRVNEGGAASISFDSDAASPLTIKGLITASEIVASQFKTASSGERIEIDPGINTVNILWYNSGGSNIATIAGGSQLDINAEGTADLGLSSLGGDVLVDANVDLTLRADNSNMSITGDASADDWEIKSGSGGGTRVYRPTATASDGVLAIRSNVGSTNNTNCLIYADGDIENTNNSYGALSDRRLKKNIKTARSYLDDLRKVRVTTHTLKATNKKLLGPIAQELQPIFPGMVRENDDGYLAVKHSVFVPMLITAVQELADRIEVLENA